MSTSNSNNKSRTKQRRWRTPILCLLSITSVGIACVWYVFRPAFIANRLEDLLHKQFPGFSFVIEAVNLNGISGGVIEEITVHHNGQLIAHLPSVTIVGIWDNFKWQCEDIQLENPHFYIYANGNGAHSFAQSFFSGTEGQTPASDYSPLLLPNIKLNQGVYAIADIHGNLTQLPFQMQVSPNNVDGMIGFSGSISDKIHQTRISGELHTESMALDMQIDTLPLGAAYVRAWPVPELELALNYFEGEGSLDNIHVQLPNKNISTLSIASDFNLTNVHQVTPLINSSWLTYLHTHQTLIDAQGQLTYQNGAIYASSETRVRFPEQGARPIAGALNMTLPIDSGENYAFIWEQEPWDIDAQADLKSIPSLRSIFELFDPKGIATTKGSITGPSDWQSHPTISIDVKYQNGTITHPARCDVTVDNLQADINYTLDTTQDIVQVVTFQKCEATARGVGPLSLNGFLHFDLNATEESMVLNLNIATIETQLDAPLFAFLDSVNAGVARELFAPGQHAGTISETAINLYFAPLSEPPVYNIQIDDVAGANIMHEAWPYPLSLQTGYVRISPKGIVAEELLATGPNQNKFTGSFVSNSHDNWELNFQASPTIVNDTLWQSLPDVVQQSVGEYLPNGGLVSAESGFFKKEGDQPLQWQIEGSYSGGLQVETLTSEHLESDFIVTPSQVIITQANSAIDGLEMFANGYIIYNTETPAWHIHAHGTADIHAATSYLAALNPELSTIISTSISDFAKPTTPFAYTLEISEEGLQALELSAENGEIGLRPNKDLPYMTFNMAQMHVRYAPQAELLTFENTQLSNSMLELSGNAAFQFGTNGDGATELQEITASPYIALLANNDLPNSWQDFFLPSLAHLDGISSHELQLVYLPPTQQLDLQGQHYLSGFNYLHNEDIHFADLQGEVTATAHYDGLNRRFSLEATSHSTTGQFNDYPFSDISFTLDKPLNNTIFDLNNGAGTFADGHATFNARCDYETQQFSLDFTLLDVQLSHFTQTPTDTSLSATGRIIRNREGTWEGVCNTHFQQLDLRTHPLLIGLTETLFTGMPQNGAGFDEAAARITLRPSGYHAIDNINIIGSQQSLRLTGSGFCSPNKDLNIIMHIDSANSIGAWQPLRRGLTAIQIEGGIDDPSFGLATFD